MRVCADVQELKSPEFVHSANQIVVFVFFIDVHDDRLVDGINK